MWMVGLLVVALAVIYYTHLISKWRNPRINGVLPQGSMGWPLIGETLQFITPGRSLDIHPFVKKRMQKYGPIFKTSLLGKPTIISTDNEVNRYILQHEGTLVELWYLDSFAKFFALEGENRVSAIGEVHRYTRSIALKHFGAESLRESLLPKIENMISTNLAKWATQGRPVDMKQAIAVMVFNFTAKEIVFGYDAENSKEKLSENYTRIADSFLSLPLKIPGTIFYKCMQDHKKMKKILKDTLIERLNDPSKRRGDFLDQAIDDLERKKFLNAEHETILKKRETPNSSLAWEEYRSMTFTQMVVNETLRISNPSPGIIRRALKDFQVKGYTIPSGWTVLLATPAVQLNPETFKDPLTFDPCRWKDLDQVTISKNFIPFGGGTRHCAGAEFSKLIISTFLHVLVTKYRFTKVKGGRVSRNPIISFGDGIHIKFTAKDE
ncbi:CYTOCHROME P450 87A3-LIKE [Salix purpurea]|uniref:CYTOCHROME P450 87A3-LIKE n=1 Tax=Salix purpurea TaxID=77065 RepID=A0A9Q0VU47_SALPP|nr:CYTOCHROME P450 87A3-LIKE [Salix purpurea]